MGQGVITDNDKGVRGGMLCAAVADGGRDERSFRRWAWKDRCFICCSA